MNWEAAAQTRHANLRTISLDRLNFFLDDGHYSSINLSSERLYPQRRLIENISVFSPQPAGRIPTFEEIRDLPDEEWIEANIGDKFGPAFSTHWFRIDLELPAEWNGQEVHLIWDTNSEGMVWSSTGEPLQGLLGGQEQQRRAEFIITQSLQDQQRNITFYIEMAANAFQGNGLPEHLDVPKFDREFELTTADVALFDREAWDLKWDFQIIADLARELPADNPLALEATRLANKIINVIDPLDKETWPAARQLMDRILKATNGSSAFTVFATGHCHIDSAWLWPYRETKRKAARSWASQLAYIEQYPSFKFVASQAQQYAWVKEDYPQLFERVREHIADSNGFFITGGHWVEMDGNLPAGESFVRQFLFGQRFYEREFGKRCTIFWLPDSFGYSGALPQILKGCGLEFFLTQKLSWSNINAFEHHSFIWEGIDGTQILSHFPPADTYNSAANVRDIIRTRDSYKELGANKESYCVFGNGDGGGGPQMGMIEQLSRMADVDGLPKVVMATPEEFFHKLNESKDEFITYVGELYLEFHRGCYTTQATTKKGNRDSEQLMKNVEFSSVLAFLEKGLPYPQEIINKCWEKILTNQFHDVLPGSSIQMVYDDAKEYFEFAAENGHAIIDEALNVTLDFSSPTAVLKPTLSTKTVPFDADIVAVNSLSFERTEVVECEFLEANSGTQQISKNGCPLLIAHAPSLGYEVQSPETKVDQQVMIEIRDGICHLENDFVLVEIRSSGKVQRMFDKVNDREVIEGKESCGNTFVLFNDDLIRQDAWDIQIAHLQTRKEISGALSMEITENGPLRATVEFHYQISDQSHITQSISLTSVSARLDFHNVVEWHESWKFLKVEFPVNVRASKATYEIAFGHLERPTTVNTTIDIAQYEVMGYRWADLSEHGFGVALINDNKYGYEIHRNVMTLSLLRSPKRPDPQADMGSQTFGYAIYPHAGTFQEGGVIQQAHAFNNHLMIRPSELDFATYVSRSYFSVNVDNIIIDVVKKAEDSNGIILRLYEAFGSRGKAVLRSNLFAVGSAFICNMLEDEEEQLVVTDNSVNLEFTPFQVVTVKLNELARNVNVEK